MKKTKLLFIVIVAVQISCSNTKNIAMFQEVKKDQKMFYNANMPLNREHRIQLEDNLYLSILTLDPEVNKLFNPSLAGNGVTSGTQQMFGDPTSKYINGYRVASDSSITVPILGEINLVGLTLQQAEERLKEKAEEYLKEPTVQVKFLNFKVNVSGEIRNPGIYYNYEGSLNILDAISMANGITNYADLTNVVVQRQEDDMIFTRRIDFTDKSLYASEVFYLQPNDMVYVPPTRLKRRSENSDAYAKLLSTLSLIVLAVSALAN